MKQTRLLTILWAMTLMLAIVTQSAWAQSTSDIGKVLAADGKMYKTVAAATNAGTTASGIIAYWGAAGSVESGNSSYRGMAIALEDASLTWGEHPNHTNYCSSDNHQCSTATSYCSTVSSALNAINGIAATTSAQEQNGSGHWHNAPCNGYNVARPSGSSIWAIPSVGQWKLMAQGLTGKSSNLSETDNPDYTYDKLSAKITAAGGNTLRWLFYWSSTEVSASNAYIFDIGGINSNRNGSRVRSYAKNTDNEYTHVRMFFAFSSATAAVYTISYNANGGSGAPLSQTKDGGIDLTLSNTVPTRTGYTFAGWNTAQNGSGTSYASGATFSGNENTTLYAQWDFLGNGSSTDPFLIPSAEAWNLLSEKVNVGTNYSDQYFRLTNNISVTTMIGTGSGETPIHSFCGTFDGGGHTLTFNMETNENLVAPFRYINGATIKNLIVAGSNTSSARYNAGLVALSDGATTISNCVVSAIITNNVGSTPHGYGNSACGGILALVHTGSVTFNGCRFSGKILGSANCYGGFVGWGNDTPIVAFNNCLFAPTELASNTYGTNTFYRGGASYLTFNNSYYLTAFGEAQGKQARSITAGTYVTIHDLGDGTEYDVSGITAYAHGIKLNDVYYAGNGDKVNLTLSHDEVPTGFSFGQYTVTGGGTLANPGSSNPSLIMTDANQTINVEWTDVSQTFNYTGDVQTFTVPATGYYTLECYGAQGGYSSSGLGGKGGLSQLTYPLTQGDVLYIYVGGQGGSIADYSGHPEGGDGGWNGGGKGGSGVQHQGQGSYYSGGGGGGGATHIATSDIGPITGSTDFTSNHANLLLIAGGGGGGLSWGSNAGGAGGGAEGGKGRRNSEWNIAWNNGTLSCGKDGMTSSTGSGSAEGCGGGGAGYQGGNTWTVTYNANDQSYSGAGGSSWGETTNGINYSTTSGGATEGGNGKAVITLLLQGSGTSEDPYLISSVDTWNNLADQVNAGTTYSGKYFRMTKDISVTTMVGNSESNSFRGTFDGNGHTLNISYSTTSDYTAPFRYIQGATFKNLKVTGSITTTMNLAAGIAGLNTGSAATFEQCVTDVAISSSSTAIVGWGSYDYHGGFLARTTGVDANLTDCVCGGSVDGSSASQAKGAGFVGLAENCTVTGTRCLSTTSYTNISSWNSLCHSASANRSVSIYYYVYANDNESNVGTQVTTSQLSDGSYATDLQDGRPTTVWVQYLRTNQPMLKQFTKYTVTYHANGGSGSVPAAQDKQQGDDLMLSNSTLTLSGFAQTGWNTNSDGTGSHYDLGGTYSSDADVTLYAEWDFQGSGTEGDPYLIPSEEIWNYLADKVSAGNTYSGKFFQLTEDIGTEQNPITRMIGIYSDTENEKRPFSGTFDGNGHTLTVNYSSNDYETRTALFSYVKVATIRNLIVAGNCGTAGRAASIVGESDESDGLNTVTNCVSSVTISGGLVGGIALGGNVDIRGCLFNGTINGTSQSGGIVCWGKNVTKITNCLFAPQNGSSIIGGTFYYNGSGSATVTNCYYMTLLGDAQGKQARSITAGTNVTISGLGDATATYNVSGIIAYSHGIKYNTVYYAGSGDAVNLNLGYTPQSGYSFHSFTASAGTLTGSSNPYTLTMAAANATINVRYSTSKSITAATSNENGWYLIASPFESVTPSSENGFITNSYDLFQFNQSAEMEWQNWEQTGSHYHFDLEPGRGYLYANSSDVTLTFIGTPYSGTGEVNLEYSTANPDERMRGWNLIGNPFGVTATIENPFYRMNNAHNEIILAVDNNVAPMEGVFVQATGLNQTVTFSTGAKNETAGVENRIVINLSNNKGTVIDRAIVSFDEGRTLPKFQIRDNSTRLYIPKDGKDYAIAFAYRIGELPLNFKAQETGVYTLNFNGDNMTAVSLIDMIEGAIIDLSVNDTYTFIGTSADRADRFKLVFSSPNDSNIDIFAYQTGNEIVVSGEGELQAFDVMGRMVISQHINGVQTVTQPLQTGVYIFRLNEKSQKIVVR